MRNNSKIILLVLIATVLFCFGCKGKPEKVEPQENQFDAKVLEIHDEYLIVEALEGQTIAGEVQVWTGLLSEKDIPELEEGVIVRITHDEKMTMSLPPQMSAIEKIIIIENE